MRRHSLFHVLNAMTMCSRRVCNTCSCTKVVAKVEASGKYSPRVAQLLDTRGIKCENVTKQDDQVMAFGERRGRKSIY